MRIEQMTVFPKARPEPCYRAPLKERHGYGILYARKTSATASGWQTIMH